MQKKYLECGHKNLGKLGKFKDNGKGRLVHPIANVPYGEFLNQESFERSKEILYARFKPFFLIWSTKEDMSLQHADGWEREAK